MGLGKLQYIFLVLLFLLFSACEPKLDEFEADAGELDLTTFVSLGEGSTAGFADGALYRSGQMNSMGNILASQLMHAGLPQFNQPLMKDELGFGGRIILTVYEGYLHPEPMPGVIDPANFENIFEAEGPFHNMGVPEAEIQHLTSSGHALLNDYFARFASSETATILDDALDLKPTFFSLWIGNIDILKYALDGGEARGITPTAYFEEAFFDILDQLTEAGAKGVIGNIPEISEIPFFNIIDYNELMIEDQSIVDSLNAYITAPHINFSLGQNPLVVEDLDPDLAPFFRRQLKEGELVLLTAMDLMNDPNTNYGITDPLPAEYYLSLEQLDHINNAVQEYNDIIIAAADQFDLAYVDVNTLLKEIKNGIALNAMGLKTGFVRGGAFSLDGINLSARGNAIVVNEFIQAINDNYNANIPQVFVNYYPGIRFP